VPRAARNGKLLAPATAAAARPVFRKSRLEW